jgi:hypothetical protein
MSVNGRGLAPDCGAGSGVGRRGLDVGGDHLRGKHFEATVTITNRDGAIVFAHNSKKENFQSAAQNIAGEIKKHIEKP